MPGQHAGDPGTAAAPTDLAASRSAVLTLELRYFTRHRDFTAIRSPRGTAGLRSSYSLPAASSAPHSPPRRCEQPASHRRYTTPGSAPRPAGTEDPGAAAAAAPPSPPRSSPRSAPGRWRPWPELSAARGSARPEWLRLNGSNMATSWKLPSAGTGRGAGRGGSGRRAVTVPSRGRPLRSGPGVPRAAACGALREVRAVRSVPLRWGHRAGRSPELRELRRYRSDAPRAAGSPRCNDSGRPPWRRRVACGLGWVRSRVPRARCRRAARRLQRAEVGERSLPARSTRPAPSQRLTSAALQQLLARSGGLLALWCPLLQCSYREELLRASGSLSHRRSPHRTCIPVVQHASAFPTLHRFRPDVIVFSSSFPIGAMRASKWNVRLSKECKSTAEEHIEAPRQVRSAYNLLHMRVSEKLRSEQKGSSSGEHSRNPFSTFGHTLRPLF